MAETLIYCTACGKEISNEVPQPCMYVSWSHPTRGGSGAYFCLDCADVILARLGEPTVPHQVNANPTVVEPEEDVTERPAPPVEEA